MVRIVMMLAATLASGLVHASPVVVPPAVSLKDQVQALARQAGYTLQWRLSTDALVKPEAFPSAGWVDATYGALQQVSADSPSASLTSLAVPIVCHAGRTLTVTTLDHARAMLNDDPADCEALR